MFYTWLGVGLYNELQLLKNGKKKKRAHIYYSLWHKSNIVQIFPTMTRCRQRTYAVYKIYMKRKNAKLQNKNSG